MQTKAQYCTYLEHAKYSFTGIAVKPVLDKTLEKMFSKETNKEVYQNL